MKKIRFIIKYLLNMKGIMALITFLTFLSSGMNLLLPYLTKEIFDSGIMAGNIGLIIRLSLLLIGIYVVKFFVNYYSNNLYTKSSVLFTMSIKKDLYSHLLQLPMRYFDQNKKGYLLSRIDEANSLSVLFSSVIFDFIATFITAIGALYFILSKSWVLGAVSFVFLPLFYLLTRLSLRRIHVSSRDLYEVTAKTKGKLQESIEGIQELKQLNNEEKTFEELKEQINKISAKTIKRGKFAAMGTESVSFLMNTSQVLITIIIGIFIVQGNLSIGDYMALTQYVLMLYAPVQLLATFSMTIQPGLAALERIGDILSEDTEKRTSGISVESIDHIEFRNVSFHYETRGTILNNVTFTMKKGENVSLEGVNGSGKSTIVKLLLGLYPDYSGVININGINLKDINIKSLRDKVGIVSQNVILFSGTLLDNIKMANPNISDEGLGQLLEIFNDKVFQDMDPYAMMISEKGNNLSGGQRQKIAILRAMAKDPEILIFDEATSNLDNASKMLLKNAICNIFDEKTCIIISHEEEISGLSDIVLQVDEGTVTKKVRPAVIYEFDKR